MRVRQSDRYQDGHLLSLAVLFLSVTSTSPSLTTPTPVYQYYPNVNSAFSINSGGGRPYYRLISTTNSSIEECAVSAALYVNESNPSERCLSASFFKAPANASYNQQCWCYVLPKWIPLISNEADSVQLLWPCVGNSDCSYNGECNDQSCDCSTGWKGSRCQELDLQEVNATNPGLRLVDENGQNISTWGAPMLMDKESGLWHAWASEMLYSCGINSWTTNSHIVHATSKTPFGPWTRLEEVVPSFAHEPDVVQGPRGDLVMVYSFFRMPSNSSPCTQCANGMTLNEDVKNGCGPNRTHTFHQMMMISPGFNQPWGEPFEITKVSFITCCLVNPNSTNSHTLLLNLNLMNSL